MVNVHRWLRGECSETLLVGKTALILILGRGESEGENGAGETYERCRELGSGAAK